MSSPVHITAGRNEGFTLIELLVVVLIIGVLAAIAIPSFLSQKNKATDANAKEMARTAELAAETYASDHAGNYGGIEPKALHEYEGAIQTVEGGNNAWLSSAAAQEAGKGYSLTAVAATSGDKFTIARTEAGVVTRTCKAETSNKSGCQSGVW